MDLRFTGSPTSQQEQLTRDALDLLRLDLDLWPIRVDVEFTQDPDPTQPDEFAVTEQLAPAHYALRFRNDAPHFHNGPAAAHFDITKFFLETVAHEFGHVLSFSLNAEGQTLVASLFDTTPDAEFPAAKDWQHRPGESIAETFKDAFMPQQYREYSNRTLIPLPLRYYPLFRAIYRHAVTQGMLTDAEKMKGLAAGSLGTPPASDIGGVGDFSCILPNGDDAYAPTPDTFGQDLRVGQPASLGAPWTWFSHADGFGTGPIFGAGSDSDVASGDRFGFRLHTVPRFDPFEAAVYDVHMEAEVAIYWDGGASQGIRFRLLDGPGNGGGQDISAITVVGWPVDGGTGYYEGVERVFNEADYGIDFTILDGPGGETTGFVIVQFVLFTNLNTDYGVTFGDLEQPTIDLLKGDAAIPVQSEATPTAVVIPGDHPAGSIRSPHSITGIKL